jgi:hypothetical protein
MWQALRVWRFFPCSPDSIPGTQSFIDAARRTLASFDGLIDSILQMTKDRRPAQEALAVETGNR